MGVDAVNDARSPPTRGAPHTTMIKLLLASSPLLILAGCAGSRSDSQEPAPLEVRATRDLATMAEGTGDPGGGFGIFGNAVLESGVTDHLEPGREYTLIVVRDRDLDGFLADLGPLEPEAVDTILAFHVLPGRIGSESLSDDTAFETLCGQRLFVSNWGGEVEVYARDGSARSSRARIVETDVPFDQGLIHFVDRPLVPATADLATTLEEMGDFEYLLAAAQLTGTSQLLESAGAVTLFAPTDRAFEDALGGAFDPTDPANVERMRDVVETVMANHMLAGRLYARDFATGSFDAVGGGSIDVEFRRTGFEFGGARIVRSDIETRNGVVHVVDGIIGG